MIVEDDALGTSQHHLRASSPSAPAASRSCCATMGVAAGDRVLVRLPNSIDYPTAFLGASSAARSRCRPRRCSPPRRCATCCRTRGAVAMVIDEAGVDARWSAQLRGAGAACAR